jgi:hypothetical protein
MTKLQAIRWFANQLTETPVTIARQRLVDNWGMDLHPGNKTPRLLIPKDLLTDDENDKLFRKNMESISKVTKGFSNVTLAILHEYGHWETRSVFDVIAYHKINRDVYTMEQYMKNPFEQIATQWAVCWLQQHKNRAIAKQFEKFFFGHE